MTLTEARSVARIVGTADSGCSVCVGNLVDKLNDADLGFAFESTGKDLYAKPGWWPYDGRDKFGIYVRVTLDQR